MASYYTSDGTQQHGPFTAEQLAGIDPNTQVWTEGWPEWRPARTVPALASRALARPPALSNDDRIWTVHDQGRQYGPHTLSELAMLVGVGTVSSAAMAWRAGAREWVPVSTLIPMPAFGVGPSAGPTPATNRIACGIFGLLLGGLGIHKFIMGFPAAGIIMLVVTVVTIPLTCGVGYGIMAVIGFIEGIIYLTKTDAEFHREYVLQKKQWF